MLSDAEQREAARNVRYLANVQRKEAKIWLWIFAGVLGFACAPMIVGVIAAFVMFVLKLVFPFWLLNH